MNPTLIPDHSLTKWTSKAKKVKHFKRIIDLIYKETQDGCCAYCGLSMGIDVRRRIERDHIAPDVSHPEFRFHPNNLVSICSVCNGFEVKSGVDTIVVKGQVYEESTFTIIHPRLDDIHEHIEFSGELGDIPFALKTSPKGNYHITLFDLQSLSQISLRRQQKEFNDVKERVRIDLAREMAARGL